VVFEKSLVERGLTPGQKLIIEYRYATGDAERLPQLVAELIGLGVDALLISSQGIPVAVQATRSIPIIMTFAVDDPVERGWAASLARPGGNVTGITLYVPELTARRCQPDQGGGDRRPIAGASASRRGGARDRRVRVGLPGAEA
jgi:putative ABC transport system substrate-binding protein